MLHGLGVVPFLEALIALILFLQRQIRVDISQSLLFLQNFLCLLALLEHIWGSVLCQRLVVEMDSILVPFFFEIGIANSSIRSEDKKGEKEESETRSKLKENTN